MIRPSLPRRTDDVLVKAVLDGDPGALDELFEAWFPRAWAHARAGGRPVAEAERLVEAAFVDAIADLPHFRTGTSFAAFLLTRLRAAERRVGLASPPERDDA